jgi:L-threonylcarbamoyladenylate synthase
MVSTQLRRELQRAVAYLQGDGVVAFPTDTFYGLGADVYSEEAVSRVFRIKSKGTGGPLPVLLADVSGLSEVAVSIPALAWQLAERFWPGALTLVLERAETIPAIVSGGHSTVGVRVPDNPLVRALVRELGRPITGTSANPTGLPPATSAAEVRSQLGDAVDYVLDGGTCPGGQPSTVLDLTGTRPRILRAGKLPLDVLQPFFPSSL